MTLVVELTTRCNLRCKHCLRDWERPPRDLSLHLLRDLLVQAKKLGFRRISLTGGEPTLHPQFEEVIHSITEQGLKFGWMCNGARFSEVAKLFLEPEVAKLHGGVCFSLDGPDEETHDAVRGAGSYKKVVTAAQICRLKNIPFSFKTIVHKLNVDKSWETVRLAGSLGAADIGVAVAHPSPRLIAEDLLISVEDYYTVPEVIKSYPTVTRGFVHLEGNIFSRNRGRCYYCFAMRGDGYNVTPDGRLSFCCNLSGSDQHDRVDTRKDILSDLSRESLARSIARHAHAVADYIDHIMTMEGNGEMGDVDYFQCLGCHKYFGKFDWLHDTPGEWRELVWGY